MMYHPCFYLLAAAIGLSASLQADNGIHYYNQEHCEVYEDIQEPDERAWVHHQEYMEHGGAKTPR